FWRATPHPFLTTFDAPLGVQSCTRRIRSNTPLQALTMLNDPAFVEIAEGLAARGLADRPDPASGRRRIPHAVMPSMGPPPLERELNMLQTVLAHERADGARSENREGSTAVPSLSGGCSPSAPWVTVSRVLLNLDEFMTRE